MSLIRDPEAPSSIRPNQRAAKLDPEVQSLEDERAQLRANIVAKFGSIKAAMGTELHDNYHTTLTSLERRKEQVKRLTFTRIRRAIFNTLASDI